MQKYQVEKIVGQGSFGKAYLVRRKADGKRCIIKQISIGKMGAREVKQTELEATLLQRLQHPNIVKFMESFKENRSLMICMEYADGGDLENYLKNRRGKLLSENEVLHMFVQLVLAMKHVHDRKILHRDLKSQNVFLVSNGSKPLVKLGDFGVSRVMDRTMDLASTMVGTPYYMPPEICNNTKYNSKCDVWSLGIILYELLALRYPFDGRSIKDLYNNICNRSAPPVNSAYYSRELRETLTRMMEKRPNKRPSVNSILTRPVVASHIDQYLNAKQKECEQALPKPPPQTPPRSRGVEFQPPRASPPPAPQADAHAGGPRIAVNAHENPKVAAYYERVRQERAQQKRDEERRMLRVKEQREHLAAKQAAAIEAREKAQARIQAVADARARKEAEALELAAKARARLNAQKLAREKEKAMQAERERARAEAQAAKLAKDRELEKLAIQRRKDERAAFEKKQEAARKLARAKDEARDRDIAAAAKAIRQAKIDRHNEAIKERERQRLARAAAKARADREAAAKEKAIESGLAAVERRAHEFHVAAVKADVAWPAAEVVVLPPTPPSDRSSAVAREKERKLRIKQDEEALRERRRANLAKFEADVLERNRQKDAQKVQLEKQQKARAAAMLQQKELALMVKGLPINVSAAVRDNVKVGNLPADVVPRLQKDPVNADEGEPFKVSEDSENSDDAEMARIKEEYADNDHSSSDTDSDFADAAAVDDSVVEVEANEVQSALSSLQLDIVSDDSSVEDIPSTKEKNSVSPHASPAWLNNLEKQMGQIHSDVAVLKALSPRSGPASNLNTPIARSDRNESDRGVARTPQSAPVKPSQHTPLAMRALGNSSRSNVQNYLLGKGTPISRPSSANAARAAAAAKPAPVLKQTPEERAVAALERRALAKQRQDDLRAYMKAQRLERIRERAGNANADETIENPASVASPDYKALSPSPSSQKRMRTSKSTPAMVVHNRNPSGRDYSNVQKHNSGSSSKGSVVVDVPAHDFNYLSADAPANMQKSLESPTPKRSKEGQVLVIENTPGSLSRELRPAEEISTAARSRSVANKSDSVVSEGINPRSGHCNYVQKIVEDEENSRHRVSTKPAVPSRVVPPRTPQSPKSSSNNSMHTKSVPVQAPTADEKRAKREKQRADMRQAMKAQKKAGGDVKSDIEFALLIPPGESPYHNAGIEENPVQHKHLVAVDEVPASYVNGPFEDTLEEKSNDDDSAFDGESSPSPGAQVNGVKAGRNRPFFSHYSCRYYRRRRHCFGDSPRSWCPSAGS
eukprot:GSChrysophyteH1.ASY1.ANO1.1702.1 assembled CDS